MPASEGHDNAPQTAGAWNFVVPPAVAVSPKSSPAPSAALSCHDFQAATRTATSNLAVWPRTRSIYIEAGEIRHALSETMVTGSLQDLLRNIRAVSREQVNFGDHAYPYLAASGVRSRRNERRAALSAHGLDRNAARRTIDSVGANVCLALTGRPRRDAPCQRVISEPSIVYLLIVFLRAWAEPCR